MGDARRSAATRHRRSEKAAKRRMSTINFGNNNQYVARDGCRDVICLGRAHSRHVEDIHFGGAEPSVRCAICVSTRFPRMSGGKLFMSNSLSSITNTWKERCPFGAFARRQLVCDERSSGRWTRSSRPINNNNNPLKPAARMGTRRSTRDNTINFAHLKLTATISHTQY